jgi:hypothetical protein
MKLIFVLKTVKYSIERNLKPTLSNAFSDCFYFFIVSTYSQFYAIGV